MEIFELLAYLLGDICEQALIADDRKKYEDAMKRLRELEAKEKDERTKKMIQKNIEEFENNHKITISASGVREITTPNNAIKSTSNNVRVGSSISISKSGVKDKSIISDSLDSSIKDIETKNPSTIDNLVVEEIKEEVIDLKNETVIEENFEEAKDTLDDGYNERGFNSLGYHKNGTKRDNDGYDYEGFSIFGYDKDGYNREGFNRLGYNRDGYDIEGFDANGYNKDGYNRFGEKKK